MNSYGGVSPEVAGWFRAVDRDGSGAISATELQPALSNGNWTPFSRETCDSMIALFDRDASGTINLEEFSSLWGYIDSWKKTFDGFDQDRSGSISQAELGNALRSFGYNLSPNFVACLVQRYDKQRMGAIQFEQFISACVKLQRVTGEFRKKDAAQNGTATLRYEDYLEFMLSVCLDRIGGS